MGVFFITQNPLDIPDKVLGQLGNRVQHALRAFTLREQKAVKAAAETFRANPELNVVEAITELGVGEALISCLDEAGRPSMVERAYVLPSCSQIGLITAEKRQKVMKKSPLLGKYEREIDRQSAYELLQQQQFKAKDDVLAKQRSSAETSSSQSGRKGSDTPFEKMAKSAMSSIGRQIGNELARGFFGLLKKR